MKTATLALTLVLSAVQTVGWVECCCILICKHRNDPCADCKEKQEAPKHEADCCAKKEAPAAPVHQHEKRCSHVEPSSEIALQDAPPAPVLFDLVLDLPLVPQLIEPSSAGLADGPSRDSRGSPPPLLHLLYSALLI
jgi:hypothetical protein